MYNNLVTIEAQPMQEFPTSQYFVKLEAIPSPNETTQNEIKQRVKFGVLIFLPAVILSIVALCLKESKNGPTDALVWMNVNFWSGLVYLANILTTSTKLKDYLTDQISDQSIKFMKVCKLWMFYVISHVLDNFLYFWAFYGFMILISGADNFDGHKSLQIILGILSVVEALYFLFVTPKL